MASFQVDAEWESKPYCKMCGRDIVLENATHYCCRECAIKLGLREPDTLLERIRFK